MRLPILTTALGLTSLATAQSLIAVRPTKPDVRLADILNPVVGFLECSKGDAIVQALCRIVSRKVGTALAGANIRVGRDGILFVYDDPTDRGIDTGHSCTVTADITNTRYQAKLLADAFLDFSGNPLSVSDPALFVAELPVELAARIDIKQKFGQRLLGSCVGLGSDSFHADGSVSTTGKIAILFTFAPSAVKMDNEGNYIFTIKPVLKVAAQLANTDINFNISGVSFLNGLVTAILGGTSSILKAVTSLLKFEGLGKVWNNVKQHVIDVVAGGILSIPFDLLDDLVELLAKSYLEEKANGMVTSYTAEFENKLRSLISGALGLDSAGQRQFVVRKDFLDLINRLGDGADVFLPDKPAGYCTSAAECSDGKFCNGAEQCVNNKCVAGSKPCFVGEERCVEASKRCVSTCGSGTGKMCPRGAVVHRAIAAIEASEA